MIEQTSIQTQGMITYIQIVIYDLFTYYFNTSDAYKVYTTLLLHLPLHF